MMAGFPPQPRNPLESLPRFLGVSFLPAGLFVGSSTVEENSLFVRSARGEGMARRAIGKKLRFEVFKRDSFTCQYCGKQAPDVVLHVDHITPVKTGGANDILNYITACADCNLGKGPRELSDNTTVSKQKSQLDAINERREQMKLMIKWREELSKLDDDQVKAIEKAFHCDTGYHFNSSGKTDVKKWLKKYDLEEIMEAVELSRNHYFEYDDHGELTEYSINKAFNYIPRICNCRRLEKENPHIKQLNYIKGIVRKRCSYYNQIQAAQLVNNAYNSGVEIGYMLDIALNCRHWSGWKNDMYQAIEECGA